MAENNSSRENLIIAVSESLIKRDQEINNTQI